MSGWPVACLKPSLPTNQCWLACIILVGICYRGLYPTADILLAKLSLKSNMPPATLLPRNLFDELWKPLAEFTYNHTCRVCLAIGFKHLRSEYDVRRYQNFYIVNKNDAKMLFGGQHASIQTNKQIINTVDGPIWSRLAIWVFCDNIRKHNFWSTISAG